MPVGLLQVLPRHHGLSSRNSSLEHWAVGWYERMLGPNSQVMCLVGVNVVLKCLGILNVACKVIFFVLGIHLI